MINVKRIIIEINGIIIEIIMSNNNNNKIYYIIHIISSSSSSSSKEYEISIHISYTTKNTGTFSCCWKNSWLLGRATFVWLSFEIGQTTTIVWSVVPFNMLHGLVHTVEDAGHRGDSAQKAFDELEQTNTGEKPGPGTDSRVERNREGKLGNQNQSEDFFQTNMTPIEKAGTPSIHEEKLLETNTKKKQKDGDDWWLKDGHTVQTNKRKQKKDKITTAKRQLKISTPQSSNTSTAKPQFHGSNELRTTTAPSPKHNDESPSTAEIKSPIAASNAASDKAKSSKGSLQQQNEKLRRNLQKAIQAAKDARAQRQRLSQEVKEVKSINSNLQQKLEENTKVINKLKLANGTLTSTNEALEAKVESMTKQLTVLERTQSPVLIDDERHEQLEIEPTNRLDVINDDGTKGTLLNDSTALSIKATKQHMAQVTGNNGKQDIDETIIVNVENSHMPTDTRLEDIGTNEKLEKLQNQLVELQNKLTEQQQNAAKTKMVLEETLQKREEQLQGFAEKMASLNDEYQQLKNIFAPKKSMLP